MSGSPRITLRAAEQPDAEQLHVLIASNMAEGHLLPRTLDEITVHAARFVVAVRSRKIVGCAELAPLSPQMAEIRSLAVDAPSRHLGIGTLLVDALSRRARHDGFDTLCAFTHAPGYFMRMGFSIVPHLWVPEKIFTDCVTCPQFRRCGQYAMELPLEQVASVAMLNAGSVQAVARHA